MFFYHTKGPHLLFFQGSLTECCPSPRRFILKLRFVSPLGIHLPGNTLGCRVTPPVCFLHACRRPTGCVIFQLLFSPGHQNGGFRDGPFPKEDAPLQLLSGGPPLPVLRCRSSAPSFVDTGPFLCSGAPNYVRFWPPWNRRIVVTSPHNFSVGV